MRLLDVVGNRVPPELLTIWAAEIDELTEIQERAIHAGVLDGAGNLLIVAPTSSGKTFIGEMAAAAAFVRDRRQRAVFLVPFRALADEHFETFKRRYGFFGQVVISTGDWSEFDDDIRRGHFQVAVMTYERLATFLVQDPRFLERLAVLVLDEAQMVADPERGPELEVLITRALTTRTPLRLICLSASMDDITGFDRWLRGTLVASAERPIPLTQGAIAFTGEAILEDGATVRTEKLIGVMAGKDDLVVELCRWIVASGKQVVVFAGTPASTVRTAGRIIQTLAAPGLPESVAKALGDLEESDALPVLRKAMASGVAIHNAEMTSPERRIVEHAFRNGEMAVIVATSTLAMGVNLPTDYVVIADTSRPLKVRGQWTRIDLTVAEYRNAAGRAGRLGKRKEGTALIAAEGTSERDQFFRYYVQGPTESLSSQIPKGRFDDLIFNLLCGRVARTAEELVQFITHTFAYQTYYETNGGLSVVRSAVDEAISVCLGSGLVQLEGGELRPTQVAHALAGRSVSLETAARIVALLGRLTMEPLSTKEIIFELTECPEAGGYPYPDDHDPRPTRSPSNDGCRQGSRLALVLRRTQITEEDAHSLVRTHCALAWMAGMSQHDILRAHPRTGLARVQSLGKNLAWLLEAVVAAARVSGVGPETIARLKEVAAEARYGLPAPLAPIAALRVPTITRDVLLRLYQNGSDRRLYDPHTILDSAPEAFDGLLLPLQVDRLKKAILEDEANTLRRWRAGHSDRADQTDLPKRIVDALYVAEGEDFEQAIADALSFVGLTAKRIAQQRTGQADIHVQYGGTIIVAATASRNEARPVSWDKAREALGASAGENPINCVCVARPSFHNVASMNARAIARETGDRRLLLMPIEVLAECVVRICERRMSSDELGKLLATRRGVLEIDDLPESALTSN